MYQLVTTSQVYNNVVYLDHTLKGDTPEKDVRLVGDRVPSYGVINFGGMNGGSSRRFLPSSRGIFSDMMLRSLYPFTLDGTKDETTLRLYQGNIKISEWRLGNDDIPFRFPEGAIINPEIAIEVKPKLPVSQLLLYWQPVHVLSYLEV